MSTRPPDSRRFDWFRVLRRRWRGDASAPPWCRGCGYSVQGLTRHTCPECGAHFSIVGVLDPGTVKFEWWKPVSVGWLLVMVVCATQLTDPILPWLPGKYSGSFNLNITGSTGQPPHWFSVILDGKREASWYWRRPGGIKYSQVNMRVTDFLMKGEDIEINPSSLEFRDGNETFVLTATMLSRWLDGGGQIRNERLQEQVKEILSYLHSAGDGTLPLAGHPGWYLPTSTDTAILHHRIHYDNKLFMRGLVLLGWAILGFTGVYLIRRRNLRTLRRSGI